MTILKSDHREELFGFCQTKMSLLVKYFSHISMRFSLYKRPSCQTFQMLWINLEKLSHF